MGDWNHIAENQIREAIEQGVFEDLPGKGQPLDLSVGPFEDRLAPTFRRILRDNGATHPLIEARRELEQEMAACRRRLEFAWAARRKGGSEKAWQYEVSRYREDVAAVNREIRMYNLRTPIANFALHTVDVDQTIAEVSK